MWLRRFYRYLDGNTPGNLSGQDVSNFLSHLAVKKIIISDIKLPVI